MKKIKIFKYVLLIGVFMGICTLPSKGQYRYHEQSVLDVIQDLEEKTSFRFLYREALLADITLSFTADSTNPLTTLKEALHPFNLSLKVNSERQQAIIFQQQATAQKQQLTIHGQVVDGTTGERLPYATITWKEHDRINGLSTKESGNFTIKDTFQQKSLELECRYVGYGSKKITLDLDEASQIQELTFRLTPERIDGNYILITGSNSYSNLNKQHSTMVDIGTFSPMGESNTLRALQALPSISLSPLMSDGMHVRGSPSDALQVKVDNITIYNRSHLFGLIDSFNGDILKRSGFYYDIAPLKLEAPPGGTLSLLTKTGSMDHISGTAGISNSSIRMSLEGPLKKGRSSWLISGRRSYMNTVDWFHNSELVQWGLNVNRPQQELTAGLVDLQNRLLKTQSTSASFYDLHGKLYFEGIAGSRLILSGYWGGDDTNQNSKRLFQTLSFSGNNNFEYRPVTTTNDWQNGAATAKYQYWLGEDIFSTSLLGTSIYQTSFIKDDFTYMETNQGTGNLQAFIFPFGNESVLNKFKAKQQFEFDNKDWLISSGISYNYFLGEYYEQSFGYSGYFNSTKAHKIDGYAQLDFNKWDNVVDVFGGIRFHYYSNGRYLKWSPRVKIKLFPNSNVSWSAGFSRNHQFINQLSLSNTVTANVWILADSQQPPTTVNYFSTGSYFDISDWLYAQIEGYHKTFDNVRMHEVNTFSLSNTTSTNPWYTNNTGTAKGAEFLLQSQWSIFTLSQTFALSEVTFSNPDINNGQSFYADWDRTYRYSAMVEANPFDELSLYLSWMYASGTPNRLATFGPQRDKRLDHYQRTDISAEYKRNFPAFRIVFSASVMNLFDRNNPWYRELNIAVNQNVTPNQFHAAPVDVYDIGLQPSFNIRILF
ncbi:TonB-dependent receptor [Fodinibius halophilus]|uniref:TonB-dependent receptor n=1 Tax=Fodinibius halophilus TaxID=1736908 RepID=A0A6M1T9M9_9BACT|nr:TonB-dependent receptor [Fodinibius halophilus]NGP88741.1 TonB-dependent receptor [Fodinibius halophilus]